MEEIYINEESDNTGFSITGENSRVQDKIQVVRQVLTLLEDTISSAKTSHQQKQITYQSEIAVLEEQIRNLRQEMYIDKEDFDNITGSFEDDIQKYLNLENKLLTIEERCIDDYEIIPKLSDSTDIYVAQYLPSQYNEWQRLQLHCQGLNHSTQNYQHNIAFKRFRVKTVTDCGSNQRYVQAMEKANALNIFRGKKGVPSSPIQQNRCVCLTWYKNEVAAKLYTQQNYRKIVEQVFKEQHEYNGTYLEIEEVFDVNEIDLSFLAHEITIHVQAKTSARRTEHLPRRTTLYQFDETTTYYPLPITAITTFNVEAMPVANEQVYNNTATSSSVVPEPIPIPTDTHRAEDHIHKVINTPMPRRFKVAKLKSQKRSSKPIEQTLDILSMIGFNDDRSSESFDTTGSSVSVSPVKVIMSKDVNSMQNNCTASDTNAEKLSVAEPVIPRSEDQQQEPSLNTIDMALDGIVVNQWSLNYAQEKGITKLTDVQKQAIQAFKENGDIIYEGVANGGKTTGMIVSVLDCIIWDKACVQGLIITANPRSTKLIQKAADFITKPDVVTVCERLDQLMETKNNTSSKTFRNPNSRILVGTLAEASIFMKNLIHKDSIRYLMLHKGEEIFSTDNGKEKEHTLLINKILYALDATVKVIVVRRSMTKCAELDAFCERKLRQKQVLKESVDMHDFLLVGRQRTISSGSKPSNKKSNTNESTKKKQVLSRSSTSRDNRIDLISSGSATTSRSTSCSAYEDNNENIDETEELGHRTFITEEGLQLLGISRNIAINNDNGKQEPERLSDDITHLYANIENGDDSNKIDMISMLNLEEDKAIIFCDSVEKAEWISTRLRQNKLWPQVLHENVSPKDQRVILQNYKQGSFCRVLVCTDFLMSISLDSADVVVNFDLPKSISSYISRSAYALRHIKNCDLAERKGVIVNLILNQFEALKEFEISMGITIHNCED